MLKEQSHTNKADIICNYMSLGQPLAAVPPHLRPARSPQAGFRGGLTNLALTTCPITGLSTGLTYSTHLLNYRINLL